ncbi:MAG: hypothetical protein CRN43_06090 [Candidatus Nephrothrix sp. EaCA]|nr:MAG: hypothetical protein CRN43_06090 [Candidatus Nephrothrix sp. EaCA]
MKNVKIIALLLFSLAFCLLMACDKKEKEAPDVRGQFLGAWKGSVSAESGVSGAGKLPDVPIAMAVTKTANTSNKLTFTPDDAYGAIMTAVVDGNAFTFDENTRSEDFKGKTRSVTTNGSGTINGNTMTISGTTRNEAPFATTESAWSMNLTKQ